MFYATIMMVMNMEPLAFKLRPQTFDEIIGQTHLVGEGAPLRKMVENKYVPSIILYGTPGIGKTTIALAICNMLGVNFATFNASTDSKATLKEIIEKASKHDYSILIVDEIHRMKKDTQDYLLPYVEKGTVNIIGITTVNPYHSVSPAIRSRCLVYKLKNFEDKDLEKLFERIDKVSDKKITFSQDAKSYLIAMANGEVRTLINMIEGIYLTYENNKNVELDDAKKVILKPSVQIDKNEDSYYETLSGLHKSIRGSDVDASLHYLAKLLVAEDFIPLVRRLLCICYEDISLANPSMGPKVKAACDAALELGMPEARLPLASVVVEMALSPKSNSTLIGIDKALKDIEEGHSGNLPPHLKNVYSFDGKNEGYKYPHDYPGGWVKQQYLPDAIKNRKYYTPKNMSKYEEALNERYEAIEKAKKEK